MSIIYILLLLFVFCFVFAFLTRKYRNPYKLYMCFGKKGSGKSTYLTKLALMYTTDKKYVKRGYKVYTNMLDMTVPGVRLISVDDLGKFVPESDSVLLLDEVGMIWDNRDFKAFKPEVRNFFKLQRHYHVICFLCSQTFDIDKKLRDLTDAMYLFVNLFGVISLGKRIVRRIVLTESTSEAESRISENLKFAPFWNWTFTWIPKYKKYYNSFDVPDMPKLRFKLIQGVPTPQRRGLAIRALRDLRKPVTKPLSLFAEPSDLQQAREVAEAVDLDKIYSLLKTKRPAPGYGSELHQRRAGDADISE